MQFLPGSLSGSFRALFALVLISMVVAPRLSLAALSVADAPAKGDFILVGQGKATALVVEAEANPAVVRAVGDLAADIEKVTTSKPEVVSGVAGNRLAVVIGVLGQSKLVDDLVAAKKLDVTGIAGAWEAHVTQVVESPWPGVERALVIAGSDRRGAIYGVYELSETIGVSPWNWWADVPVTPRKELALHGDGIRQGAPAVKFRGIFLNDEDFALRPWASKTFDPETGNIGPKTYAKIFELLLRLRANLLWPAMHHGSKAFNLDPENKVLADRYGIVMGSSHCEQMLCNNVDEWDTNKFGEYNYVENRDGVLRYWEARVRENAKFESLYTLGMRGIHDSGMPGGGTKQEQADRLHNIIADQRDMLARYVNTNLAAVPQIFCPYKEVLALYRLNPHLPEDITLVWPDDNFGYVRSFSDDTERQRSGGAGVYYHVSYWGAPCDYLWLQSTPPALIREEMAKAYDYGASNTWVLNVGDIKPAEWATEFFLQLAWNPHRWHAGDVNDYLAQVAARDFGPTQAKEIAAVLAEYYRLNFQRKPEHLSYEPRLGPYDKQIYSFNRNGDETAKRAAEWNALLAREQDLARKIPAAQQDAYFQLVGYPVNAAGQVNLKALTQWQSAAYAAAGRNATATIYAGVLRAHDAIKDLTERYNNLSGGKWRRMMSAAPHNLGAAVLPKVVFPNPLLVDKVVVDAEGGLRLPPSGSNAVSALVLPQFNREVRLPHFVDIYRRSAGPVPWSIVSTQAWMTFSQMSGSNDARVWVDVNWVQAPKGDSVSGAFTVERKDATDTVLYDLHNPVNSVAQPGDFVEDNFRVVMEAEHANQILPGKSARWEVANGLGYNGQALALNPVTAPPTVTPQEIRDSAPALKFRLSLRTAGEWTFTARCLPVFSTQPNRHPRFAFAFDDGEPQVVDLLGDGDEKSPTWQQNVLRNAALPEFKTTFAKPGRHTLTIWMVDPGMVFDAFMGNTALAQPPGYLWPAETRLQP